MVRAAHFSPYLARDPLPTAFPLRKLAGLLIGSGSHAYHRPAALLVTRTALTASIFSNLSLSLQVFGNQFVCSLRVGKETAEADENQSNQGVTH